MTWIDPFWKFSAQVSYDAIVILTRFDRQANFMLILQNVNKLQNVDVCLHLHLFIKMLLTEAGIHYKSNHNQDD